MDARYEKIPYLTTNGPLNVEQVASDITPDRPIGIDPAGVLIGAVGSGLGGTSTLQLGNPPLEQFSDGVIKSQFQLGSAAAGAAFNRSRSIKP